MASPLCPLFGGELILPGSEHPEMMPNAKLSEVDFRAVLNIIYQPINYQWCYVAMYRCGIDIDPMDLVLGF
jgi:hypothetical protein